MNEWPFPLVTYSPEEVQRYCVSDPLWQAFRLSLKGLPTETKLVMLKSWREQHNGRRWQVQVSNFINALKRGGQLTMDLKVQR